MDHNDIVKAHTENRIGDYDLPDLMEMRGICARHSRASHFGLMRSDCEAVESEIQRKEENHRAEQMLHQLKQNETTTRDTWYKKPIGVVVLSVSATLIGAFLLWIISLLCR
jgi:hypothetical protein